MKKVRVLLSLMLVFCFLGCSSVSLNIKNDIDYILSNYDKLSSEELSEKVFRLHIIANSNLAEDQEVKYKIRDKIIEKISQSNLDISNVKEAKKYTIENISKFEKIANEVLKEEGFSYVAKGEVGRFEFPYKDYGDFYLPKGEYDALRVVLGEGKGNNWWCVLYPPLCFVNVRKDESTKSSDKNIEVKWFFSKLFEKQN